MRQAGFNNQQALQHFQVLGINEGRAGSQTFDVSFYLENNQDLRQAGFNNQQAFQHYLFLGINEGRLAAPGIVPEDTDGDLNTALDVGALGSNISFSDSIGGGDLNDFYRFTLNAPSQVSLTLEGLGRLNIIRDINGNNIVDNSGNEVRFISFSLPIPDEIIRFDFASSIADSTERFPAEIQGILPAGTYFIQVEGIEERPEVENYNLSLAATPANLPPDNVGNTFANALDIGILQETRAFTDFVALGDRNDVYRFTLNSPATVNLAIEGLNGTVFLGLLENPGTDGTIGLSDIVGQRDGSIVSVRADIAAPAATSKILAAGTYFVRVAPGDDTNYNLGLSATPFTAPPDNAGNSIPEARELGILGDRQTLNDAIGFIDPTDFYRFTLENPSLVSSGLSTLSDDDTEPFVRMFTRFDIIQDTNGNGRVDFDASLLEIIRGISGLADSPPQSLPAGTYFARVRYGGEDETIFDYDLTLEAVPFTPPPDGAGNSLSEAREVDILTGSATFEDFVGNVDRKDVYRFNLESESDFSLVLNVTNDFTPLRLVQDFNDNGTVDPGERLAILTLGSGRINETLAAGIYFVEVEVGSDDTNYNLTLSI